MNQHPNRKGQAMHNHKPGTMIPTEYTPILEYCLGRSNPDGEFESYCVSDLRRLREAERFVGELDDKCDVCGAVFKTGMVYRHEPSGDHIVVGHQCGAKIGLLAHSAETEKLKALSLARRERANRLGRVRRWCRAHREYLPVFKCQRRLVADIWSKLWTYGSISGAQLALAVKVAAERAAPAPVGKATVVGTIKTIREQDGWARNSTVTKMLVACDEGFAIWTTKPAALEANVGDRIELTGNFEVSKSDFAFGFCKRPRARRC